MSDVLIVGLLSLAGTLIGTGGGILVSQKLVNYRLEQLEKKVDKHNSLVERMYKAEAKLCEHADDIFELKTKGE